MGAVRGPVKAEADTVSRPPPLHGLGDLLRVVRALGTEATRPRVRVREQPAAAAAAEELPAVIGVQHDARARPDDLFPSR